MGIDRCLCQFGWKGKYCDTVVGCYGVAYNDPLVCSGSGTCNITTVTTGTCSCNTGCFRVDCRYKQYCMVRSIHQYLEEEVTAQQHELLAGCLADGLLVSS